MRFKCKPRPLSPSLSPDRSGGEDARLVCRSSESEGGRAAEGERSIFPEQVRNEQVALQLPSPLAQVAGDQSRAGSKDRRPGEAKRTRRAERRSRPAAQNARTEGRKEAVHDRAEAKHDSSAKRRKFIHLRWKALYDKRPWVPEQKQFLHVHWKQPFRRALWGRLRNVQVPTIGIELPRLDLGAPKPFVPRWWSIRWKKNLIIGELRIQDRVLFRKAPKWSPLHGLTLPALQCPTCHRASPLHARSCPHCAQAMTVEAAVEVTLTPLRRRCQGWTRRASERTRRRICWGHLLLSLALF